MSKYHKLGTCVKASVKDQRGITGLASAIVLIAFVVVAAVFAFVVITTGLFSGQRAQETLQAGLKEARTSLAPKGSVVAVQATVAGGHTTGANVAELEDTTATFVVDGVTVGDTIENLTDGSNSTVTAVTATTVKGVLVNGTDNDWDVGDIYRIGLAKTVSHIKFLITLGAGANSVGLPPDTTLVTFIDENNIVVANYAATIPNPLAERVYWTHSWPISGTSGPSLDSGEVAEFIIDVNNITSGVTGSQTVGPNTRFNIEVVPRDGSPLTTSRTLPLELQPVMDLN